ncbi:ABC transporter permease [Xylophilus rhododendri]|uniref:ABC transporter permease n=1 Tax=Xylophilus rhododendri TaxID=2697032 RepID=A0A857J8B3_9BURK|nr:ABC transporter permease [Xylophilus rhododendri]QHI99252.1 ABC transporter permease [Xylophilus rhododendri]
MDLIANWLGNMPDAAVPFALAALGLIVSERAGVLSLGAEGLMLVGALAGIGVQLAVHEPGIALIGSMLAAAAVSVLFAVMVVWLRVNQVIAGLALVFFCQGLTGLLGTLLGWTNQPVTGLTAVALGPLVQLPVVGKLFHQNVVVYLVPFIIAGVVLYLNRSVAGLRLRAVGENPQAADAAGIPVLRTRFLAIVAGSALVGLAGGYIAVISTKLWIAGMTGGRGWIAVGLVIFARWSPWRAFAGALLFGGIETLIPQLSAAGIAMPQYFVLMTPYLVTLGVMVWVAVTRRGADETPGALGEPYLREERR